MTDSFWSYFTLRDGRLMDEDGEECNPLWPSFEDAHEAEGWLEINDIRATLR